MSPPGPSGPEHPADTSSDPDRQVSVAEVPLVVAAIAAGNPIRLVWQNDLAGRTYRVDRADRTEHAALAPDPRC